METENKKYYSNLKRYDATGKRVAIFGIHTGDKLQVDIIRCSRKDQFCKKFAKEEYERKQTEGKCKECHPETHIVDFKDPKRPKWSFLMWVNDNFYRLQSDKWEYGSECIEGAECLKANIKVDKRAKTIEIRTLYK